MRSQNEKHKKRILLADLEGYLQRCTAAAVDSLLSGNKDLTRTFDRIKFSGPQETDIPELLRRLGRYLLQREARLKDGEDGEDEQGLAGPGEQVPGCMADSNTTIEAEEAAQATLDWGFGGRNELAELAKEGLCVKEGESEFFFVMVKIFVSGVERLEVKRHLGQL